MKTREQFIDQVKSEHEDWTDEQVAAEADRLFAAQQPDPDPDPKPDDAAFARMRREKQEAEDRAKTAEDALAAKERAEAEQAGEWEKLAKQYETERDAARQETADLRLEIGVERIAGRLKIKHPKDAITLLPAKLDRSDDTAVEKALSKLIEDGRVPVDTGTGGPTGRPAGSPNTDLTIEQVKKMSPREILARQDEVDAVLATQT